MLSASFNLMLNSRACKIPAGITKWAVPRFITARHWRVTGAPSFVQSQASSQLQLTTTLSRGTSEAWVCIASLGLHHPYAKYSHHLIVEKSNIPSLLPTMQKCIAMSMAFIYEHVYSYCSERPPCTVERGLGEKGRDVGFCTKDADYRGYYNCNAR